MIANKFGFLATALCGIAMAAAEENSGGGFAEAVGASDAPATPAVANGKEFKWFFKTEKVKDDQGTVIGEGRKHPDVTAVLPVPQAAELQEVLQFVGETESDPAKAGQPTLRAKVASLVLEAMADLIYQAGRNQINDWREQNPKGTFTATNFNLDALTLEFIASQDRASRGAWTPSDEDMKSFTDAYSLVLLQEVQYEPKKVKAHVDQFNSAFKKIKGDKVALAKMGEFLTVWAGRATEEAMEENLQTYEWLGARLKKYLAAEEKNYADAL